MRGTLNAIDFYRSSNIIRNILLRRILILKIERNTQRLPNYSHNFNGASDNMHCIYARYNACLQEQLFKHAVFALKCKVESIVPVEV